LNLTEFGVIWVVGWSFSYAANWVFASASAALSVSRGQSLTEKETDEARPGRCGRVDASARAWKTPRLPVAAKPVAASP